MDLIRDINKLQEYTTYYQQRKEVIVLDALHNFIKANYDLNKAREPQSDLNQKIALIIESYPLPFILCVKSMLKE